MPIRLIRRRRSRRERVAQQFKELRKNVPASLSLPDRPSLPDLPELPKKPPLPAMPEVHLPRRQTRDTSGDTPFLSLTGGLLLGLVVGMIVAAILLNRRENGASGTRRPTRITLLPNQEGGDQPRSRSTAGAG